MPHYCKGAIISIAYVIHMHAHIHTHMLLNLCEVQLYTINLVLFWYSFVSYCTFHYL